MQQLYTTAVQQLYITAVYNSCIQQLYTTAVYNSCIQQLYTTAVYNSCTQPQLLQPRSHHDSLDADLRHLALAAVDNLGRQRGHARAHQGVERYKLHFEREKAKA
jgi:hypothetical protein